MAVKHTFEELKLTDQLPSPPGVGMRVLELTRREDYAAQDIAEAIMADSALTGRLLKIANSALLSSAQPVTTINEATMRLGVSAVRNVALGLSLITANRNGRCAAFNYERYWAKSLGRALAAQAICRTRTGGSCSEAYVMGLLCEIGSLALASVYPEQYSHLLAEDGAGEKAALLQRERELFGITHNEVGAFMIEDWGLPRTNAEAVLAYAATGADAGSASPAAAELAAVLKSADVVAEVLLADPKSSAASIAGLMQALEAVGAQMGLDMVQISAFHEKISREFQDWVRVLKLPSHSVAELKVLREAAVMPKCPTIGEDACPHATTCPKVEAKCLGSGSMRILVASPEPVTLRIIQHALEREGHAVITAADGREALQAALEHNPQAVIADWTLSRMDGIELCRTLRSIEQGREMFYMLLTGSDDEQRIVQAFDAGVDDFIIKPLNPRMLLARLKSSQRVIDIKAARERDRREMSEQVKTLAIAKRRLNVEAKTDALTGVANRRSMIEALETEWTLSESSGAAMSVIMIDIDHFKKINDQHGHDVGDAVLCEVAKLLRRQLRQGEDVARFGGEEFLVLCPNASGEQAAVCAERMRHAIEHQVIRCGSFHGSVTASFGVAERTQATTDLYGLLKQADEAVYSAKADGRNRVRRASDVRVETKRA